MVTNSGCNRLNGACAEDSLRLKIGHAAIDASLAAAFIRTAPLVLGRLAVLGAAGTIGAGVLVSGGVLAFSFGAAGIGIGLIIHTVGAFNDDVDTEELKAVNTVLSIASATSPSAIPIAILGEMAHKALDDHLNSSNESSPPTFNIVSHGELAHKALGDDSNSSNESSPPTDNNGPLGPVAEPSAELDYFNVLGDGSPTIRIRIDSMDERVHEIDLNIVRDLEKINRLA